MEKIIELYKKNRVDYDSLPIELCKVDRSRVHVLVVIGVRDRDRFIKPVLESLFVADEFLGAMAERFWSVSYIVVEHTHAPKHKQVCSELGIDYVWLKCNKGEPFNRSLAFNVGYLCGDDCDWVLTHDIDCMVQSDFYDKLFANIKRTGADAIQTFANHRVIYCLEYLTDRLISGKVAANELMEGHDGTFTAPGMAMGGSIMIKSCLFERVGMYDPELFTGYAPEDQFLWHKLEVFTKVQSCDDPENNIFHLHHPFMGKTNPRLPEMNKLCQQFTASGIVTKRSIIDYKFHNNGID